MTQYMELLFFEGDQLRVDIKTLAVVLDAWPVLGRGIKGSLPHSRPAPQGWKRLGSPMTRPPLPWTIVGGIAQFLSVKYGALIGLITVLAFRLYHRPRVAASLVEESFSPLWAPKPKGAEKVGAEHLWTVSLHWREWERPRETGTWEEAIVFRDHEEWFWVAKCLDKYLGGKAVGPVGGRAGVGQPACGTCLLAPTLSQLSRAFGLAAKELNQQLVALFEPVLRDLQDRAAKLRIQLPRLPSAAHKAGSAQSVAASLVP